MTTSDLLGLLRAYLTSNDEGARLALADAFAEAGDERTAGLLRGGGFPLYSALSGGGDVRAHLFHSLAEREAFLAGFEMPTSDDCHVTGDPQEARELAGAGEGEGEEEGGGPLCAGCGHAHGEHDEAGRCERDGCGCFGWVEG